MKTREQESLGVLGSALLFSRFHLSAGREAAARPDLRLRSGQVSVLEGFLHGTPWISKVDRS
jgi:hypothetical protein